MTMKTNAIVAIAVSAILSLGVAQAAEQTMKPLQGVTFHSNTKHAVAYFLSDNGVCNLVITSVDDAEAIFTPTRYETAVDAGESTVYQFAKGNGLEFACQAEAQAMTVKSSTRVAGNNGTHSRNPPEDRH